MVSLVRGNVLKSDCNIIAHGCNCSMGYGAGFAYQVKQVYPEAYNVFMSDTRKPEDKLGRFTYVPINRGKIYKNFSILFNDSPIHSNTIIIFNLYQQLEYGKRGKQYIDYNAFKKSLEHMSNILPELSRIYKLPYTKVGLPSGIGSTNAGGDKQVIHSIIDEVFNHKEVYLYEL